MGNIHTQQPVRIARHWLSGTSAEIWLGRRLTEDDLVEFCAENPDLRVELDKNGKLIIMPPIDIDGGINEGKAFGYLFAWWLTHEKGAAFSPTTGFKLPDGAVRSADAAWASPEKIEALSPKERKKFAPLVPDFVIEIRSKTDRLSKLKKKMADTWIANGVRLAWLIDPKMKTAYVYRSDQSVEEFSGFDRSLSGENVCPGFELDLRKII